MSKEESKCFLCSTAISTPPPQENGEEEENHGRGRRTRSSGGRNIIKSSSNNLNHQIINEILFKYFLSGCEDVELARRLIASSALLGLCNSCEKMANIVQDLHEELEELQVKLFEQLAEVKKVIISSARGRGGGKQRSGFGKDKTGELDKLVVEFRTFIWEKDKRQMGIPSQFSDRNDNTIKANRISTTTTPQECPQKMEVDNDDEDSDESTDDFNHMDCPPADESDEEAAEVDNDDEDEADNDNESVHSFSESDSDADELPQDVLLEKVKKPETKDGKTRSAYFCNQCSFRSLKGVDVENHFRKKHDDATVKPFQCSHCSMKFSLEQALFLHTYLRHKYTKGKRRITCDLCKASVKPGKSWRTHMAKAHPHEKQFDCELCGEAFLNYATFIVHTRLRHPYTKLKCVLCTNHPEETDLLNLSEELPRHIDEIHGISDLRLKCDESNCSSQQVFYIQRHLDLHKKRCHGDEARFQCKQCSLDFGSYSELRDHNTNVHPSKLLRYQCKQCPERFGWSGSLFKHMVREHDHPGLQCELCPETFSSKGVLETHLNSQHPDRDGAQQFLCAQCPKSFSTEKRRNDHEKTHDDSPSAKPFACDQCTFTGRKKSILLTHVNTVHASSKDFCCDICGFATNSKANLALHAKRHTKPFECPDCHKRFGCRKELKAHSYTHGEERPFRCRICGGMFKTKKILIKHKIVHEERRPFKCDFCEEDFKQKSSLIRHKKRKHSDGTNVLSKRKRETGTRARSYKTAIKKTVNSPSKIEPSSSSETTIERDAPGVTLVKGEVQGITFEYEMPE